MRDRIRFRYIDGDTEVFEADKLREHLGPTAANRVAQMLIGYSAGHEFPVIMSDSKGRKLKAIGMVMPDMSGPVKGRPRT